MKNLFNKYGLLLCVAGIVAWEVLDSREVYLQYGIWVLTFLFFVAGYLGASSYEAFRPAHHRSHAGAAALVWVGAVAIIGAIAWLVTLIGSVSTCFAPVSAPSEALEAAMAAAGLDDSAQAPLRAAAESTDWVLRSDCPAERAARLYAVLSPWQTGIGAAIGLFGVAWSTMYRSVYEDWKEYQAPTYTERSGRALS